MKKARPNLGTFTASVTREGRWFVAQCLEVDVVSQGRSERSALANLAEALELYFEPPHATIKPRVRPVPFRKAA
ncbi:MAG: type II toxin-antitoxin system HicB family antitoxin [Tagaea sp.]